jgi:hypothetical protein
MHGVNLTLVFFFSLRRRSRLCLVLFYGEFERLATASIACRAAE